MRRRARTYPKTASGNTHIGNDSKCHSVACSAEHQTQQKYLEYQCVVSTAISSDAPSSQSIAGLSDHYNSKQVCEVSCADVQMKHVLSQIAIYRFKSHSRQSFSWLGKL